MATSATIPTTLRAGDTWYWPVSAPDYPSPDWSLSYVLVSPTARATLAVAWIGTGHAATVSAATTAAMAPGSYAWHLLATSEAERRTLETGRVEILPDPLTVAPASSVSHAQRMLAAIEACLEGRAAEGDLDLVATAANGRQAQYDLPTLLRLHNRYAALVASEQDGARLAAGLGSGRFVQTRFGGGGGCI